MAVGKKLGKAEARKRARPVAARKRRAEPVLTDDGGRGDQCKAGKHPVNARIGSGCAACGSPNAWRSS